MSSSTSLRRGNRLRMYVLVIDDELNEKTASSRALRDLIEDLESRDVRVEKALTPEDAKAIASSDTAIQCVLLDWDFKNDKGHVQAADVLAHIRA